MSSSPSDQLIHGGSLPTWPPMDFSTPLSFLLQDQPPSFISSHLPSSPSPSLNPSQLLSSQASSGACSTKVSKRKSRAACKPPIRVLSADRASFREMVQKLTGIPTSPSLPGAGGGRPWGMGSPSIFRPMAARPGGSQAGEVAAALQAMPTLDTSSAYLSRSLSSNNSTQNDGGNGRLNAGFINGVQLQAANYEASGYNSAANFEPRAAPVFEGWAACNDHGRMSVDMETLARLQRASADHESLVMGSSKQLEDLLQGSSWFAGDGLLHAPSPTLEIAHSA